MIAYIDSSVLLRYILGEPNSFQGFRKLKRAVASALIQTECLRALDRLRLQGLSDRDIAQKRSEVFKALQAFYILEVTSSILERAGQSFPTSIGTLDAVHLASALLYQQVYKSELMFVTHDEEFGIGAKAMGFEVSGVVS